MSLFYDDDDKLIRRADGGYERLSDLQDEFREPPKCNCRPRSPDSCEVCMNEEGMYRDENDD